MFHIHSLGFHMDALFLTWHFSPIFLNSPQIYLPRKGHMNFPLPPPSLTPFLPFWHPSKYATTTAYHQMMQGAFWKGQEDQMKSVARLCVVMTCFVFWKIYKMRTEQGCLSVAWLLWYSLSKLWVSAWAVGSNSKAFLRLELPKSLSSKPFQR